MFFAIRDSCSLAVRAMRACTQGVVRGALPPQAEGLGGPSVPKAAGTFGSRRPPNSIRRQTET